MYPDTSIDSHTTTAAACAGLRPKAMGQPCILRRLSQWLWPPPRTVASSPRGPSLLHGPGTPTSPDERSPQYAWGPVTHGPRGGDSAATPRYIPSIESEADDGHTAEDEPTVCAYPCKACQAWGVTCDRQQPRCAHCLDQQILCFYVAPVVQKTTTRSKRTRSTRSMAYSESQSHLGAS